MNLSKNMNIRINIVISIIAILLFIEGLTITDPIKKISLEPIKNMPKCYWDLRCVDDMCICLFPIFDGNPSIYCWNNSPECLTIEWKKLFIGLCVAIISVTIFIILSLASKSATPEELANFNYHWTKQFNEKINNMHYYDNNGNIRTRQTEDYWRKY